jgi:hypothetical protein
MGNHLQSTEIPIYHKLHAERSREYKHFILLSIRNINVASVKASAPFPSFSGNF